MDGELGTSGCELIQALFHVLQQARHKHQGAHLLGCCGCILLHVQQLGAACQGGAARLLQFLVQGFECRAVVGVFQGFAPGDLLLQKLQRHGGVVVRAQRRTL